MFIFYYALLVFALSPSVIAITEMVEFQQQHHALNGHGPYVPLLGNTDKSLRGFWVREEPVLPETNTLSWSLNKHLNHAIKFEYAPNGGIEAVTFHHFLRRVRDKTWYEVARAEYKDPTPAKTQITDEKLALNGYWGRAPELTGPRKSGSKEDHDHIIHIEWDEWVSPKTGKKWAGWFVRFLTPADKNPPQANREQPILFNQPHTGYQLTPEEMSTVKKHLDSTTAKRASRPRPLTDMRPLRPTQQGK